MGLYDQIKRQQEREEARRRSRRKAEPIPESKPKQREYGGRRIAGEAHLTITALQPWVALGMSRRTWYRRRKLGLVT
jgi:hypothetical protein